MKTFTRIFSVAVVTLMSTSAFAEFFPGPDFPPPPPPFYGPVPVGVPVRGKTVKFEEQLHKWTSGVPDALGVPGETKTDEFGNRFVEPKKLTAFEIVVGPASTDRGCIPATKADGYKSWTGVASNDPSKRLADTVKTDTISREIEGEDRNWTVYQFKVNDGKETPVTSIRVFFPFNSEHGRVECHFKVNLALPVAKTEDAPPPPPPTTTDDDTSKDDSSKKEESPKQPTEKV